MDRLSAEQVAAVKRELQLLDTIRIICELLEEGKAEPLSEEDEVSIKLLKDLPVDKLQELLTAAEKEFEFSQSNF